MLDAVIFMLLGWVPVYFSRRRGKSGQADIAVAITTLVILWAVTFVLLATAQAATGQIGQATGALGGALVGVFLGVWQARSARRKAQPR